MENIQNDVKQQMRQQIEAQGEIYFWGTVEQGQLVQAEPISSDDFAQLQGDPQFQRVVLYNHNCGDLTPRGSEITQAAQLSKAGIGFIIINDELSRWYVLTEPAKAREQAAVHQQQVEEILAPGGRVAQVMDGFESRSQQLAMANALSHALNSQEHVLAEAGTGTGKSLAYLVPVLLWAQKSKVRAVISTNTINLQEQLIHKDIPLLQQAMPGGLKAVLVKGRANYLCRRKFREVLQQGDKIVDEQDIPSLQEMVHWEKTTRDGSRSDLSFTPRWELWDLVCSDGDTCLRINCPFFRQCFFHRARLEAVDAQILVVNHSLLFADIALRRQGGDTSVLPEYACIVLDEAHNVERVATDWLGARVTQFDFNRLLHRLWLARRNNNRGLLVTLDQKLASLDQNMARDLMDTIHRQVVPDIIRLSEAVTAFFTGIANYLLQQGIQDKVRLIGDFITAPTWQSQVTKGQHLSVQTDEFCAQLASLHMSLENLGPQAFEDLIGPSMELAALQNRLTNLSRDLKEVLTGEDDTLVRWLELRKYRTGPGVVLQFAPLSVRQELRQNIWDKYNSVILTSATLTVGQNFAYIRDRLGFVKDLAVQESRFESPFDYQQRVVLGIATDLPAPEEKDFVRKLPQAVAASLAASQGRALVLFTSFALLNITGAAIAPRLMEMGITLLCQGAMPRHILLNKFRRDTSSVLLATTSFWEGVDVAGESLSNVILTRLPFTVPDDPVTQARMEDLKKQGKNPFYHFQIPQAVLRFKQGFGRLIRTKQDSGVVLVLDKRIQTKRYGRWFLEALPSCPIKSGPLKEILTWQQDFLQK